MKLECYGVTSVYEMQYGVYDRRSIGEFSERVQEFFENDDCPIMGIRIPEENYTDNDLNRFRMAIIQRLKRMQIRNWKTVIMQDTILIIKV